MSTESTIFDLLKTLVGNRVYPDVAPENVTLPYITYQQIGGEALNFFDQSIPSKSNRRFQVNVWAGTRAQVVTLAKQVEDAMRVSTVLQTTVISAPVARYDAETKYRGSMQDFSVWGEA